MKLEKEVEKQRKVNLAVGGFMSKAELDIAYLMEWARQIGEKIGVEPPKMEYDFNLVNKRIPDEQR